LQLNTIKAFIDLLPKVAGKVFGILFDNSFRNEFGSIGNELGIVFNMQLMFEFLILQCIQGKQGFGIEIFFPCHFDFPFH
jgi:hypothetical protein